MGSNVNVTDAVNVTELRRKSAVSFFTDLDQEQDRDRDDPSESEDVGAERVGAESWYGSLAVIPGAADKGRGSPTKQVVIALLANIGAINAGMMFGYSAVTLPQLKQPDSSIPITDEQASWIASLSSVTTPVGCILSGYLLDNLGRQRTILVTLVPMMVGWYLISLAWAVPLIYAGRLLVGLGTGLMASPSMVYTGEISQPHLRGMLAACASVATSAGVFMQYVVGSYYSWNWLAFVNGLVVTVGFIFAFFLPESPAWLLAKGDTEAARAALIMLRGSSYDVNSEIKELLTKDSQKVKEDSQVGLVEAIMSPSALKPFAILTVFFITYQFCGISSVTYYAVQVFQETGARVDAYLATMMLGLVRLLATVAACILLRRCGRRPLTFFSSVVCGLAMYALGSYVYMAQGRRAEGLDPPAPWMPPVILYVFMGASTAGLAILPWVMIGELYPCKVRGIMGGLSTFVGHFSMFVAVKTFPFLQSVSKPGTFMLYGTISLLGTVFLYFYLPETKGKTLQEIENFFRRRLSLASNHDSKRPSV